MLQSVTLFDPAKLIVTSLGFGHRFPRLPLRGLCLRQKLHLHLAGIPELFDCY